MLAQWTFEDAENKLSEVINRACAGCPQMITKKSNESVVVLALDTYKQLLNHDIVRPVSFKDLLLSMPQTDKDILESDRSESTLSEVDA